MSTTESSGPVSRTGTSGPASQLLGVLLAVFCAACIAITVVILLIPNSVYVDTGQSEDIFFGCGNALFPGVEPNEEPGRTACYETSLHMRGIAVVPAIAGSAAGVVGALFLARRRRS